MSDVNDVVTPFQLPYQVKDALKRYVPKLRDVYGASEICNDQPIRFVNRAARFEHDPERTHPFVWEVPQPGRGTNFWIPIQVNPEQISDWHDLLDGRADPGEIRLSRVQGTWRLHVTVEKSMEEPEFDPVSSIPIGIDVGESALVAGCALIHETPTAPFLIDGGNLRGLRKENHSVLSRLQRRDATGTGVTGLKRRYRNRLRDVIERTTHRVIEYARDYDDPVLALEELRGMRNGLDYGRFLNRRLHSWAFARVQSRIEEKAVDAGIPVLYVDPRFSSRICHACGHIGSRPDQAVFRCTNEACHVTEFQADINAAANIAARIDPWGESVPWKPGHNDSPRDGSPRDRAGGPD